jgi:uncharacterized protein YbjQ (UPF0145 family)
MVVTGMWACPSRALQEIELTYIRNILTRLLGALLILGLPGCATWSTSSVETPDSTPSPAAAQPKRPHELRVTESDITDRQYSSLGDITVTVNKTTVFHPNPTREMVNQKLREEAAKLGADAVILVRYGTVGVSFMSWGSLEGKGRAIKFDQ